MAGHFLYKPIGQGQVGGGRATFLIENTDLVSGGFYDQNGNLVERFNRFIGQPEGGAAPGVKFYGEKPGYAYGENLTAKFTDSSGKVYTYTLPQGGQRYEGDYSNPDSLKPVNKGPMGGGAFPPGFAPGMAGQYGVYPAFQQFPQPSFVNFPNIKAAPYTFTDPFKFAEEYGKFSRNEITKNFDLSKDLALKELGTELDTLKAFVPAASALKRQEVSIDNQFNQAQRTAQVNAALPGVGADLEAQAGRARTLAEGRLPSSIDDRALEVSLRSRAADEATAGGFGQKSQVASKTSDLLSAEERLKISQYGDQLLTKNIGAKADLFLAPTEYSNAGQQVNVNPSVSPAQLISSNLGQTNQNTLINPGQAFQSNIQQNQFSTDLNQRTNEFNATGTFNASTFNAQAANQFALQQFGYNVQYAGAVAGAQQTDINTQFAIQQQQQYQQIVQELQHQAQQTQQFGSILQGIFALLKGSGSLSSILSLFAGGDITGASGLVTAITDLLSGNGIGSSASEALDIAGDAVSKAGSFADKASDFVSHVF